eukprot:GHVP01018113.1.p1 GENE.GHVP01018113.1~~GHVP01018113.1.p1  ORF type:complete len:1786 (-),score=325.54 GHVP01018113.1:757-5880(-)
MRDDLSLWGGVVFRNLNKESSFVQYDIAMRNNQTSMIRESEFGDCLVVVSGQTGQCEKHLGRYGGGYFIQSAVDDAIIETFFPNRKPDLGGMVYDTKVIQQAAEEIFVEEKNSTVLENLSVFVGGSDFGGGVENRLKKGHLNLHNQVLISSEPYPQEKIVLSGSMHMVGVMPFYFMFAFVLVLTYVLIDMVAEKESKMKEVMKTFGVSTSVFWLSWLLTYATFNVLLVVIATAITFLCNVFGPITNIFIVAYIYYAYLLSLMTFGFFLSVFFQTTRSASTAGLLFNITLYGVAWLVYNLKRGPIWIKYLVSTFSTAVFSMSIHEMMVLLPDKGVTWENLFNSEDHDVGFCVIMLTVDCIVYYLLAWYLDQVLQSEHGIAHEWTYPLTQMFRKRENIKQVELEKLPASEWNEEVDEEISKNGISVAIRGLTKNFKGTENKKTVTAVNKLNLDIYKGEIFALLGHNGAGKTTTISMITGMLQPDGGDAFINGASILENLDEVRTSIAVCPQTNIFFEELTVCEHLMFFAMIRGVAVPPLEKIQRDQAQRAKGIVPNQDQNKGTDTWEGIIQLMERMFLLSKLFALPRMLSGGMKRRLWLTIALIGEPSVVFLDEPTSGVDPLGRQHIWKVVQREKAGGRCVVLTTHHMEEADLLADRKAVLSKGTLTCLGSSLFLKSKFGVGYYLELQLSTATADSKAAQILAFVKMFVPEAKRKVGDQSEEGKRSKLLLFSLPLSSVKNFGPLFNELEIRKETLGIEDYAVSMSTLEEVFLQLGEEEEGRDENPVPTAVFGHRPDRRTSLASDNEFVDTSQPREESQNFESLTEQKFDGKPKTSRKQFLMSVVGLRTAQITNNKMSFFFDVVAPVLLLLLSMFLRSDGPGGITRRLSLQVPLQSVSDFGYYFNETLPLHISPDLDGDALRIANELVENIPVDLIRIPSKPMIKEIRTTNIAGRELRNHIWEKLQEKKYVPLGLSFQQNALRGAVRSSQLKAPLNVRVLMHPRKPQSIPVAINLLTNAIMRSEQKSSPEFSSRLPFNVTTSIRQVHVAGILRLYSVTYPMYIMLSVGLTSLPARFGIQSLYDKGVGTKHSLLVSGLPFWSYWVGSILVNWLAMVAGNAAVLFALTWFIPAYQWLPCVPIFNALLFYSMSCLLWGYFFTFMIGSSRAFSMWLSLSTMLLSVAPAFVVSYMWDTAMKSGNMGMGDAARTVHIIASLIAPPYTALGSLIGVGTVISMGEARNRKPTLLEYYSFENLPIYSIFGAVFQICWILPVVIHWDSLSYKTKRPQLAAVIALQQWRDNLMVRRAQALVETGGDPYYMPPDLQEWKDEDVLKEDSHVAAVMYKLRDEEFRANKRNYSHPMLQAAPRRQPDPNIKELPLILIYGLYHVHIARTAHHQPTVAVRGLNLAVYRGEVFGLLGPNGAGKSTTINLLTSNFALAAPSEGDALLGGHSVTQTPWKAFPHLGLCPQFDALWQDITIKDNIRVFARLKGVPEKSLEAYIENLVAQLDLQPHKNKKLMNCSGGNKRRASLASAICGNPDVLLLDEPSSGIDPLGRKRLADLLRSQSKNKAVVITTHSMEEAESLSSRVGILVSGELHCLNSSLRIKNKYGSGIRLEILASGTLTNKKQSEIELFVHQKIVSTARLIDKIASRLIFELPVGSRELGRLFKILENEREPQGIKEYALSQPTLEEVFIRFAKRQQAMEQQAM